MENFKTNTLQTKSSNFTQIPTGALIPIASVFSLYNNVSYQDVGLIPCDGRSLNTYEYRRLHKVIGKIYGGSIYVEGVTDIPSSTATFNVPNLVSSKLSIIGRNASDPIGVSNDSPSHSHSVTMTNNSYSMNNATVTHSHNFNYAGSTNENTNVHAHNQGSAGANIGPNTNKNGPAGTAGGALIGSHTHGVTAYLNTGNSGVGGHSHGATNENTGNTSGGDPAHTHSASITASANSSATSPSTQLEVPYVNVLYFIKI